jgi:hypothetical protein
MLERTRWENLKLLKGNRIFGGTGVCTQGFMLARQLLYCLNHAQEIVLMRKV